MADENRFIGSAEGAAASANRLSKLMQDVAAKLEGAGDQVIENTIAYNERLLQGPTRAVTPGVPADVTAKIEAANAAAREKVTIDERDLVILKAQADAMLEQTAIQERLQRAAAGGATARAGGYTSGLVLSGFRSTGPTAAAQLQLEAQAEAEALALRRARTYGGGATERVRMPASDAQAAAIALQQQQRLEAAILGEEQARRANARQLTTELVAQREAIYEANTAEYKRLAAIERTNRALQDQRYAEAYQYGALTARTGTPMAKEAIVGLRAVPTGLNAAAWGASEKELVSFNAQLGHMETLAADASLSTEALTANSLRLGAVQAETSNVLRRHGALTTEYLTALARGETTLSEFGYQLSATIGKFGGWAVAAAATYGALGAVVEFGKGAIDASSGVQQLNRTIEGLDRNRASEALRNLSAGVNVPIKEAADATFLMSRTFHDVAAATTAAGAALATYKLDGVAVTDSVKAMTAVHRQFGLTAQEIMPYWDELAQGQQKFNARVTEQIPILQQSAGAVKNAGGNLRDFIQLSTIMLATTQLTGANIGTAVRRSITNQLNPTTTMGQSHRNILSALGIDPNQNYTDLLFNILKRAGALTGTQRNELLVAVFGTQIGGRMAGFLTAGPTFVPEVRRELSASGSQGVLGKELQKELHTARQELASFIYALQRIGSAIAEIGAFTPLGLLLRSIVGTLDAFRGLLDTIDRLPDGIRKTVTWLAELRLAMLFVSRTRIGGGIGLVNRLPGFRPSEATRARQQLATANRAIIENLDSAVASETAALARNEQKIILAKQRLTTVTAESVAAGRSESETKAAQLPIQLEIKRLTNEQAVIENEQIAALDALAMAKRRQVGITAMNRRTPGRLSDEEARAGAASMDASVVAAGSVGASQVGVTGAMARSQRSLAETVALQGRAIREMTVEEVAATQQMALFAEEEAGQMALFNAAGFEAAVKVDVLTAETGIAQGRMAMMGASLEAMGTRMVGFLGAMDPFLLALLGLPLAFEMLGHLGDKTDKTLQQALAEIEKPTTSMTQMQRHVTALQTAAGHYERDVAEVRKYPDSVGSTKAPAAPISGSTIVTKILGALGITDSPPSPKAKPPSAADTRPFVASAPAPWQTVPSGEPSIASEQAAAHAADDAKARRNRTGVYSLKTRAQTGGDYMAMWKQLEAETRRDEKNVDNTLLGRERWYDQLRSIGARAKAFTRGHPGADSQSYLSDLSQWLQGEYQKEQGKLGLHNIGAKDPFAEFKQESATQIEKQLQTLDDYAQVFGAKGNDSLKKVAYGYTYLATTQGGKTDTATLQAIKTAQANFMGVVTKQVDDLTKAAGNAPTAQAAAAKTQQALSVIDEAERNEIAATKRIIAENKGNKAEIVRAQKAQAQVMQSLEALRAGTRTTVVDLATSQGALNAAQIQGVSPEADLARARATLAGLQKALANAKAAKIQGKDLIDLETQVDSAQQSVLQQRLSNADSLAQASEALSVARITGIDPAADMARAQQALVNAKANLARDTKEKKGLAQLRTDQAAIDDAYRATLQQAQQDAQQVASDAAAFIQSQSDLAQSRTTDPVKQAREQLAADIGKLATIKPADYKTHQDYVAARNEQLAKINQQRQTVNTQVLDTRMSTLKYELDTQQISNEQYLNGLRALLRMHNLSKAQIQQLRQTIFDAAQSTAVSLNVGSIRMPSTYEVRRAIAAAHHGRQSVGTSVSASVANTNHFNITVHRDADVRKVTKAIADAIGTNAQGAAQAMGLV